MVDSNPKDNIPNSFGINSARAARMSVLVVDDDVSLADFLRQFLEELRFKVYTASTGEEALSLIEKIGEVDIALIDFRLPGMDGLEAVEKISERLFDAVMVVMTGLPTLDSSIRALRLGASDYILKPFKLEDVAASLNRAMDERAIRLEIRNLREKVRAMEKYDLPDIDIKLNKNIKNPTAKNINPLP
jgi:DNA-binding NtrC family response regulator